MPSSSAYPHLPTASPAAPLARMLRRAGVTDAASERAAAVLAELDVAAFSAGQVVSTELVVRTVAAARAVDAEAVRASSTPRAARAIIYSVLGIGVVGSALHLGAMPEPLARAFNDGVTAYRQEDFAGAERLFARGQRPRAACRGRVGEPRHSGMGARRHGARVGRVAARAADWIRWTRRSASG